MNSRGQSLVMVIISFVLMAIGAVAFLTMNSFQNRATRNVAALSGVNDLSSALDILLNSSKCASPGTGFFRNGGAIATVSVSGGTYSLAIDTLDFPNGTNALSNPPNATTLSMIQPHTLAAQTATPPGINLIPLGGNSTTEFPFQMQINFFSAKGAPPSPRNKFVTVYTNSSSEVVGICGSGKLYPDRTLHSFISPSSASTITIYNPSTTDQTVNVTFTAVGNEKIYNAYLTTAGTCNDSVGSPFACFAYGICDNAACSAFVVPGGTAVTCNGAKTSCTSGSVVIPANGMTRFGIGSLLSMVGCFHGCQAAYNTDSASGSKVSVSVVETEGYVVGYITQFDDLTNAVQRIELNAGAPF